MLQASSPPSDATLLRQTRITLPQRPFGQTSRPGLWWIVPAAVFLGLGAFIVYSTWAAFQGKDYRFESHGSNYTQNADYLSPFYSPEVFGNPKHAWFGGMPTWIPKWIPITPALLILWAPGGFRFTCYYYRGAYYKAFWADPPSCAVGEPRKSYWGEKTLPLILQNIHRYFMYLAVVFLFLLAYDVLRAMWFEDPVTHVHHFGIGVGTIVLAVNVCLLTSYTLGCHSLRHLIGGARDEVSKSATYKAYKCVSCFNRRHMMWAWFSLFGVGFADIYVRLCSMGIWHDWRII